MNLLFASIEAWQKSQQFITDAKDAIKDTDRDALQFLAATWRARHEMAQALYWATVRP